MARRNIRGSVVGAGGVMGDPISLDLGEFPAGFDPRGRGRVAINPGFAPVGGQERGYLYNIEGLDTPFYYGGGGESLYGQDAIDEYSAANANAKNIAYTNDLIQRQNAGGGGFFNGIGSALGSIASDPLRAGMAMGTFGTSELASNMTGLSPQQLAALSAAGGAAAMTGGASVPAMGGIPGLGQGFMPGGQPGLPAPAPGMSGPGAGGLDLGALLRGVDLSRFGINLPTFGGAGWGSTPVPKIDSIPNPGGGGGGFFGGGLGALLSKIPGLGGIGGSLKNLGGTALGGISSLGNAIRGGMGQAGGQTGSDLALLAGLGLIGGGLSSGGESPQFDDLFQDSDKQTNQNIGDLISRNKAIRQQNEDQYLGRRAQARQSLDDILGRESDAAFGRAIQGRQEQLNRQGLLSGPSGAMDFALAQEASKMRERQLPALLDFEKQTETGLNALRGAGLDEETGLNIGGTQRNFGLADQGRAATLRQRLMDAEAKNAKAGAMTRLGGTLTGFGLGGQKGAEIGGQMGGSLDDIFNPKPQKRGFGELG